jgi:phosphotransferase system enzyme I (PtsP)
MHGGDTVLDTLHRIVHAVNKAPNLQEALGLLVLRVREAIGCDVCSIYLTDDDTRANVLMATIGLRPEAVGNVRLPVGRGLVGLVAERAEPINIADAPSHPRYVRVTDTGEAQYRGFLGVPIIQSGRVLGVLVVRQLDTREFRDEEVTFLFTLAAQLAGAITHARASGELDDLTGEGGAPNRFLSGQSGNTGVAIGQGVVAYRLSDLEAVPDGSVDDPQAETERFRGAVSLVEQDLRRLQANLDAQLPAEDKALFDALLLMLGSDTLINHTVEKIQQGKWAPAALRDTIRMHTSVFEDMEDVYLRERASDIRDLGRRILTHLQGDQPRETEYPPNTVLVGEEVSAVQLAEVPRDRLVGVISAAGSGSSHAAILARAMGVPAVMGLTEMPAGRLQGRSLIVDGYRGRVYVEPPRSVQDEYSRLLDQERALGAEVEAMRGLPSETPDGVRIPLFLNTGLVNETNNPDQEECAGVGLYRTELPFMIRDRFPGENAQLINYRRVLEAFAPRPVVLRTLDVGGDKPLPYFPVSEQNPFLGWRGVRISLQHPEIFLTQIRAMLRADIGLGNLQIMLPMISSVTELDDLILLIQRAHDELLEEEHAINMPRIGVMIEVPSAVYLVEALARRVDFISVGTNDLTQYLLAVDRNNPRVAGLYDDMHPAVLRALKMVMDGARQHGKPVSICGELAGNPLATVLLLGLGVDSLSMSVGSLLRVKWVVRSFSQSRARQLLNVALRMEDAGQVRRFMEGALDDMGLGGLFRPGK